MQHLALRYFLEVARAGSISEASSQLHVSGSAISRQIARLEDELGVALFERRPRGMALSPAGEVLAQRVRRIALDTDRALAEVRELQGPHRGTVRLAAYEGFAIDWLPPIVARYRRAYPEVRFEVWVGSSADICERVGDGRADIGITYSYSAPAAIKVERILRRPMRVLVPRGHPLAARASVSLADLADEVLALPDRQRTQRQLIDTALAGQGLTLEPAFSSNSMATLKAFALASGALLFSSAPDDPAGGQASAVVALPLEDETLQASVLQVITLRERHLPTTVSEFLGFLDQSIEH
ncbi:LysR family transcriptional regulator [Pseudomonas citronellolis]|uniref:LysR family transcriptional regulator n=1 Tax=Pseudomonas citronellolis TaxID=53408 RepID=UPI0023E35A5A|nr:LysR family transcriptional regulator [Pseudomonas citronellolis]MDF3932330.1 LysR family transcriptional regulator [Pseudomonas citronellolis]